MSPELIQIAAVLYLILNCISFFLFGVDKRKAVRGNYRISESALIGAGLIGPVGALAGMKVFRHKTRKPKFKVIYLFLMVHLVLFFILMRDFFSF
ncbi:MAG: DUF1294 domain-containing protein [Candidatus Methanoplasma sp.]|jgi:uncharacterized membrane protein YsdA (DUF1294 family)|nr:DUF1294 domain-containing protein [Candidatus Methanoplasma sp.]